MLQGFLLAAITFEQHCQVQAVARQVGIAAQTSFVIGQGCLVRLTLGLRQGNQRNAYQRTQGLVAHGEVVVVQQRQQVLDPLHRLLPGEARCRIGAHHGVVVLERLGQAW
ncbi:hypothetical protein D9M71_530920 [compost metagenome]